MENAILFPLRSEIDNLDAQLSMWARSALAMRTRRNATFGSELFADQAWDMILLLVIAPPHGMTRSELASACDQSDEMTRRWLAILVEREFIEESLDLRYRLTGTALDLLRSILP